MSNVYDHNQHPTFGMLGNVGAIAPNNVCIHIKNHQKPHPPRSWLLRNRKISGTQVYHWRLASQETPGLGCREIRANSRASCIDCDKNNALRIYKNSAHHPLLVIWNRLRATNPELRGKIWRDMFDCNERDCWTFPFKNLSNLLY